MGDMDILRQLKLESLNLTQLKDNGENFRVWFNDISHAAELLNAKDVLQGLDPGTPIQQRALKLIVRSCVPQADKQKVQD
jgi:hypothetical protein